MNSLCLPLEKIEPVMMDVLNSGGEFRMIIRGTSMLPMLRQGKDSVILIKPVKEPEINDVILYKRSNNSFVLHRIIGENKSGYILCGDNQYKYEYGVVPESVIAVMTAYERDGKRIDICERDYKRYIKTLLYRRKYKLIRHGIHSILRKIGNVMIWKKKRL